MEAFGRPEAAVNLLGRFNQCHQLLGLCTRQDASAAGTLFGNQPVDTAAVERFDPLSQGTLGDFKRIANLLASGPGQQKLDGRAPKRCFTGTHAAGLL